MRLLSETELNVVSGNGTCVCRWLEASSSWGHGVCFGTPGFATAESKTYEVPNADQCMNKCCVGVKRHIAPGCCAAYPDRDFQYTFEGKTYDCSV